MMLSGSNVERTNLIDNEDNGCIINSKNTTSFCGGRSQANDVSVIKIDSTKQMFAKTHLKNNTHSNMLICQSNSSPYTSVVNTSKQQRQDVSVTKANIILGSSDSHASNSTASNTSATSFHFRKL
ncbi:unnamed protein product [Ceratitis capitata]|uniref:(Mediterranean fruit fly) hypothetical protein n=1 Tax=Ceratitis capitata TaxID=7213 RepID=A0A811UQI0_CERCA|nr:unnamed protein product [Ceratitis capitata]